MPTARPLFAAAILSLLCVQVHADVFPEESQIKIDREKANGGVSGCDLVWCPEGVIFGH